MRVRVLGSGVAFALAMVVAVAVACLPVSPASVNHSVTATWLGGYQATVTIHNGSAATIGVWSLELDLPHPVSSVWDATLVSQVGTRVTITAPAWARDLAPGATATLGYVASLTGPRVEPTNCRLNGQPCSLSTAASPTTTSAAPTSTMPASSTTSTMASTSTSTTIPGTGNPARWFAPYLDVTLWPPPDLDALATASGARRFTLAFVVNGTSACSPSWGGVTAVSSGFLRDEVAQLRAAGGDVVVSFGGANGVELAQSCASADQLADAYQSVVDAFGATAIDFDVEGGALADTASTTRRSQAIATLQARARAAGRALDVSFTLPVLPSGLTSDGVATVRAAQAAGVEVSIVNVMAMDYGAGAAPDPDGRMGRYAIDAATAVHGQLGAVYPTATPARRWAMVGVTPMIGQNDVPTERFTVADAETLTTWAKATGIGRLAMWSVTRDRPCPGGPSPWASATCSGIAQTPWAFSAVFRRFP